jgi:TolB-like protein
MKPAQPFSPDTSEPLLSAREIQAQLHHILNSSYFQNAEQLSQFLTFIVNQVITGKQHQIKQYTIAVNAFSRPVNFNPTEDPIVRVEARRLRQTLALYYQEQGQQDPIIIDIPKGSYIPRFKRNKPKLPALIKPSSLSTLSDLSLRDHRITILVTPLVLLQKFSEYNYIADGFIEQLLVNLTQFQELKVIGPLSRKRLTEIDHNLETITHQYSPHFILTGTFCPSQNKSRIIIKLVSSYDSEVIWAETYDYDYNSSDLFQFQDQITRKIAATLADTFGVIPRIFSRHLQLYPPKKYQVQDAMLKYYHHFSVLSEPSWRSAYLALEEAVKLEPDYPPTLAMLADLCSEEYHLMGAGEDRLERHENLVYQALNIDPYCQIARLMKANGHFYRKEKALFLQEVKSTLALNANHSNMLFACGMYLAFVGEWQEGMTLMTQGMELNPHHPTWYHLPFSLYYYLKGNYQKALDESLICNTPNLFIDPFLRAVIFAELGDSKQAVLAHQEMSALLPPLDLRELLSRTFFLTETVDELISSLSKVRL